MRFAAYESPSPFSASFCISPLGATSNDFLASLSVMCQHLTLAGSRPCIR